MEMCNVHMHIAYTSNTHIPTGHWIGTVAGRIRNHIAILQDILYTQLIMAPAAQPTHLSNPK